jgi:predicted dehydrogenase
VPQPGRPIDCSDSFTAHIRFAGAVGTVVYSGGGDTRLPKERLEAFGGGAAAVLDDFRSLNIHRGGRRREWKSPHDKGHRAQLRRFLAAVAGEAEPPPAASYVESMRLTLALARSLRTGSPVDMYTGSHKAVAEQ